MNSHCNDNAHLLTSILTISETEPMAFHEKSDPSPHSERMFSCSEVAVDAAPESTFTHSNPSMKAPPVCSSTPNRRSTVLLEAVKLFLLFKND